MTWHPCLPAFACLQVDFHSFEGILYTAPGIGWLMQNVVRRSISAVIIGGAQTAAAVWPPLEGWLRRKRSTMIACFRAAGASEADAL